MTQQNSINQSLTGGGTIDNTVIGENTPADATFTSVTALLPASSAYNGIGFYYIPNASTTDSNIIAFESAAVTFNNNSNPTNIAGMYVGRVTLSGSSSPTNVYGFQTQGLTMSGTSSIVAYTGFTIGALSLSESASISTSVGVQLPNMGSSGITDSSGITIAAQSGSSGTNYAIKCDDGFYVRGGGAVIVGTAALSTSATDGFFWIPSCAGAPTGSPTSPYSNAAALIVDTTDSKLYVRVGSSWKSVTLA